MKEYYEASERIQLAMLDYELKNPEVEYLYATEYELHEGKVLVKYMRDKYYIVVIRCFEWEVDFDKQVEISKLQISDFNIFADLASKGELKL